MKKRRKKSRAAETIIQRVGFHELETTAEST